MKVAIVSKSDRTGGGASKVAEDLTNLLNKNGHIAHHYRRNLVNGYTSTSTSVYGKYEWIAKKTYYKLKYFGFQEIIPWEYLHLKEEIKKHKYDVIHFHDLTTAISPFTLILLSEHIPVIWTLHDTSGFTGGCIYPMECQKFHTGCNKCPQRYTWPMGGKFDLAFFYWKIKKSLHTKNIYTISPSNWLANLSSQNTIIQQKPFLIPNGVNEKTYRSLHKAYAKKSLKIDQNRFTVLISAANVSNIRKGFSYSIEVLRRIKQLNPFIIVTGRLNNTTSSYLKGFDYVSTGFISDYKKLNLYYSAADIFLNTTIADNMPLVVLETMSSGTPTYGFKTGGLPEMVQQNFNGFLVENRNTFLLAKKINNAYKKGLLIQQGINARKLVKQHFTHQLFLKRHLQIYSKTITMFKEKNDL